MMHTARAAWRTGYPLVTRRLGLLLALAVYAWGAVVMLPTYRWQINPDGVGYLSVAHEVLRGQFFDSINGYWSPLVSWLTVPLMAMGIEPVLAFKIMSLILGAIGLITAWRLMGNLKVANGARTIAALAMVPMLIWFALQVITSDLAVAVALLMYLTHLTHPRTATSMRRSAISGAWMGLAYLAKAYALWFVAVHYVITSAIAWRRQRDPAGRRDVARAAGVGLVVFLTISTAWALVLTAKFGRFTYGSTGQFNWAYNGPDFKSPMHSRGLLPPPNPAAVSVWDDATYLPVESWNPFTPQRNWDHFKKNLDRNYQVLLKLLDSYSALVYFVLIGALLVAGSIREPKETFSNGILAIALLLYPCGYLVLHMEPRFFWILPMLLVVFGATIPAALARGRRVRGQINALLLTIVFSISFAYPAWKSLVTPAAMGADVREAAVWLKGEIPSGSRIASSDRWAVYLYVSFFNGLHYYGQTQGRESDAEVLSRLEEYQVDYFFTSGGKRYSFLNGIKPLDLRDPPSALRGMRVYRLR